MWNKQRYCRQLQNHVWIQNFRRSNGKNTMLGKSAYFFMVLWYGRSCKEMYGAMLRVSKWDDSTTLQSIYSMHRWPSISKKQKMSQSENCQMHALKWFWNAYTWHVLEELIFYGQWRNLHDRSKKWTKACDKRLSRLFSYIHHTCEYKQYCYVGNTAKQCRLGLFQDSDFAGDLEDSKTTFLSNIVKSYICSNQLDV